MNLLTVQEQHVPGASLEEKYTVAREWGFDGLELRSKGDLHFASRLPELLRASKHGVVMETTCVEMDHFIGAFNDAARRDAIMQLRSQLSVMAAIGGRGVITPAAYGMFSKRLPPFVSPRSEDEDHDILVDGLSELGSHAASEGVELFLEPLNRYEDHMINRLDQASSLLEDVGSPAVKIVADTYHMNIEEVDLAAALQRAAPHLGHLQASDSNRLEPGAGHLDWALFGATVQSIGYEHSIAFESRLSGAAEKVLPASAELIRRYL
jgi:sugar phosphate isomerase/epimerase